MKRVWMILAVLMALLVTAAPAQDVIEKQVIVAFPTSKTLAATQYNYGPVFRCGDAAALSGFVTTTANASSTSIYLMQWLAGNPGMKPEAGAYDTYETSSGLRANFVSAQDVTGTSASEALQEGPDFIEPLFMWRDLLTTGVATVAAADTYWFYTAVKAPFARLVVYNVTASNPGSEHEAWVFRRNTPWPAMKRTYATDDTAVGTW